MKTVNQILAELDENDDDVDQQEEILKEWATQMLEDVMYKILNTEGAGSDDIIAIITEAQDKL